MILKKVVVVGTFRNSMYAKAIAEEFERQFYEIYMFNWDLYGSKANKVARFLTRIQNRLILGPFVSRINKALLRLVHDVRPDLVFIYRGTHIRKQTIHSIRGLPSVVISYHNDDPFAGVPSKSYMRNYLSSARLMNWNYVYREKNIIDFRNIGISNVSVLKSYYIDSQNYPIKGIRKTHDVVFAGHFENDGRDEYILALLKAGIKVRVYGDEMWQKAPLYEDIKSVLFPAKRGKSYNQLLNQSKIALVFFSAINSDTYTRRCFEIPAAKTLMCSMFSEDMTSMFASDSEAIYFKTKEELVSKCLYLLKNPEIISKISSAGFKRLIQDGHSVRDRVKEIVRNYERIKQI